MTHLKNVATFGSLVVRSAHNYLVPSSTFSGGEAAVKMFSIFRRKNRQRSSVPRWPACSRHTRRTEAKRSRKFKCYLCLKVNLPREGLYKLLRFTFLMSVGILSSNYFSTLCLSSNICTGNTPVTMEGDR